MLISRLGRSAFFAPLVHAAFRNFWLANIVSNLGSLVQITAAAWLMATISSSQQMTALVQTSSTLPLMLFSLAAGVIADSFDRRIIMLIAQAFMFLVSIVLAAAAFWGWLTPWLLLGFTFLVGCGMALNTAPQQTSVGEMVPRSDVAGAVSLNALGFNVTRSIGPGVGGAILAFGGASAAFMLNAVTYLAVIVSLLRWKPSRVPASLPREDIWQALFSGLRYASMSPHLMRIYLRSFIFTFGGIVLLAFLPLVARTNLNGGPLTFGFLLAAFGIGAMLAAFLNAKLRELISSEWIVRISLICFAAASVLMGLTASVTVALMSSGLAGLCWVTALSLFNSIIQLSTPRWVAGRAYSIYQTAISAGMALGSWAWGYLAQVQSLEYAFIVASAALLAGALLGVRAPVQQLGMPDLDPLGSFQEPSLSLDILPRSGPIAISVNYDIRGEDISEFLRVMKRRRRLRIRDGARGWALMRDLERPERWVETYHTPTWLDYVRHNQRRTRQDSEVHERLRALHRGDGPPIVTRMIERETIPETDDVFHQFRNDTN